MSQCGSSGTGTDLGVGDAGELMKVVVFAGVTFEGHCERNDTFFL